MLKVSLNKMSFHSWRFFYLLFLEAARLAARLGKSDDQLAALGKIDILLTPIFSSEDQSEKE